MTGGLHVNKREGWVRKLMGENGEEDPYIIIVIGCLHESPTAAVRLYTPVLRKQGCQISIQRILSILILF